MAYRYGSPSFLPPRQKRKVEPLVRSLFLLPDCQMPPSVTLWRGRSLLDRHFLNLVVVGNDGGKTMLGFRSSRSALKGVHDVLQSVVYIMPSELVLWHVERDKQLKRVLCSV